MSAVTFYFSPNTRAVGTLILLEELGVDYQLEVLNMNKAEQREPAYLAINPSGKVPAIVHENALITEQPAIYLYLSDLFADKGLAPAMGDPRRGPYLSWMVYYGSCMEPAIMDRFRKVDTGPVQSNPYGSWEMVLNNLRGQLEQGPWFLGEDFTSLDVLWASSLGFFMNFGLLPEEPVFTEYSARFEDRPAVIRAREKNVTLAAELAT